jgi:hypothetical protein
MIRGDFDFRIVNHSHLDGDVISYGVYVSQLIRFARDCSNVKDLNKQNIFIKK